MGLRTWIYKATGIKLKNFNNSNVQRNNSTTSFDNTQQINAPATSPINAINESPSEGHTPTPDKTLPGFIGREIEKNINSKNISINLLDAFQKKDYCVVCFYTQDNEYAEIVKKLKASLEKFNIPHKLVPVNSVGAWELNCATKAKFIQLQWEQSDIPIVWLDADATVEKDPVLFSLIDCDFAAHKWQDWQFGSGTLYFAKTELAKKLIDQWVVRCEADPTNWDQTSLQSAWCDISSIAPLRTCWLPASYLAIFDCLDDIPHPIIQHWQASRQSKKDGRTITDKPQFEYTTQGRQNRENNILWRTHEEAFWILEGTQHIKPEIGQDYPEGFDVETWLREAIGAEYPLLEVGCGVGRIARLFKPEEYTGVDINPNAIACARAELPEHHLRVIDDGMLYPKAGATLLYTVLLHVSDTAIKPLLTNICKSADTIIIAELMDRRWRRDGNPPVYNREPEDYILMMQSLGYTLAHADKKPCARYDVEPSNVGKDSRITALVFKSQKIYEVLGRELITNPESSPEALDTVVLNNRAFKVARHWFWPQFVEAWEKTTWNFYKRYTKPGSTVIDIGSWIGPTLMFAALNGAKRLIAVEGNPETVKHLQRTKKANPEFFDDLTIHNGVIYPTKGKVSFGNADSSQATSSASSTRGSGFEVDAFSIQEIIEKYQCADAAIIKIDIEGSEFDVINQISKLASLNAAILLSLHPPFWKHTDEKAAKIFIDALEGFHLYTPERQVLTHDKLAHMIMYKENTHPSWGTPFGNFFEIIMLPKN